MARWRPGERVAWDGPGEGAGTSRPPLPDLPCFPALRGWAGWCEGLARLGLRHAADLLRPPAPAGTTVFGAPPGAGQDDGFRVLDGVWLRARGTRWRRVDEEALRTVRADWSACGDPRAAGAVALVDPLLVFVRHDPAGLRRVVLWQVACLLRDGTAGPTEEAAVALGVHRDEARYLAAAVALGFAADGPGRAAAERLADEWPDRRLCRAERTLAEVPDTGRDHVLAEVARGVRARRGEVDRLVAEARRLGGRGAHRAAGRAWFGALRRAVDDPALERGLLGAAADAPPADAGPRLDVTVTERTVRLRWPAARAGGAVAFRLLRFADGLPDGAEELAAGELPERVFTDRSAPVGSAVRYALVPSRAGRTAGVPLVSAPVVVAPAVLVAGAVAVPQGVRVRWRADPACAGVTAVRRAGGSGEAVPVPCGPGGLLDVPLPPGRYTYEIHCRYPAPGGRTVRSAGVRVAVRAEEWPGPVEDLTARLVDGGERVALTWRPPDRGGSTVLTWPSGPVRPGVDASGRTDVRVPERPWTPEPSVRAPLAEGSRLRLTAVSTLAGRALTGPDVIAERPGTVQDLTVRRISADRAAAVFVWPEPAVLVLLAWEGDGRRGERRVARSRFLADGVAAFPVTAGAHRVTVTALPRPDALSVPADAAHAELAALPPPLWPPLGPPRPGRRWRWPRRWPFRG
ncbi:hypothetical protein [Streptomyces doudnae]|uniref:Fibronectin type-III domain-containing protein n=1 Tax=Streptomyces doudnae TaxID=3075536 RepID=A0ABD5EXX7_9ACTN|nr:hypothetical protein [Streptomyces sp. DSM 41981]MDT0438459.1 hypothetical protein [Streptomyces sp. DSM 41981]